MSVIERYEHRIDGSTNKLVIEKQGLSSSYPLGRMRLFGVYCSSFRVLQLIAEFTLMCIFLFVAFKIAGTGHASLGKYLSSASSLGLFISFVTITCMGCMGLYSTRQPVANLDLFQRLSIAFIFSALIIASVYWVWNWEITLVESFAVTVAFAFLFLARFAVEKFVVGDSIMKHVLILGNGERVKKVYERSKSFSEGAYSLHMLSASNDLDGQKYGKQVLEYVSKHGISEIVLAYEEKRKALPVSVLLECKLSGVAIRDAIEFLERESGLIDFDFLEMGWMVFADGFSHGKFGIIAKRLLDVVVSTILLIVSAPLFILAAVAIKLDSTNSGPVFYHQKRVGLDGRVFDVWKFRSMYTNAEADGKAQWAVESDSRITTVGAILRKYRIDELPQLLNVLMGDMSLVGPRPERPEFVTQLSKLHVLYSDRHRVKPGLTGWAQMRFPYTASTDESIKKLQYDMYYVKNRSLLLDSLILMQTVEIVLCGKGAR